MQNIRIGIVGGAGYTAGELLRIVINHPNVEIVFVHSISSTGKKLYEVHRDLLGDTDLEFTDKLSQEIDLIYLCLGHGDSKVFLSENPINSGIKIIDLSQDFRLLDNANSFVYGLPELNKNKIQQADFVANPGCFATAIQLALLPLANAQKIKSDVYINAITGSTGAGQKPSETTHFSYRSNNISVYKAFSHQHLGEINQSLSLLQADFDKDLKFIPQRGDFARGIFVTVVLKSDDTLEDLMQIYKMYYKDHPFTHLSDTPIDLKQVVNTNKCLISIEKNNQDILITSTIDNLLKGASGQAVQNMNLMFNLDQKAGLNLKASAF
ncbi:N-acetyl-gamma-glutamyl-phosphate reductase [Myroides sp. LJL110]